MGVLRAILPKQQQPHHCVLWLGQDGQGRNGTLTPRPAAYRSLTPFYPMTKKTLTFCLSSRALRTSPAIMMGNVFHMNAFATYSERRCGRDSHFHGATSFFTPQNKVNKNEY